MSCKLIYRDKNPIQVFRSKTGESRGQREEWTIKEHRGSFRDGLFQISAVEMVSQAFTLLILQGFGPVQLAGLSYLLLRWQSKSRATIRFRRVAFEMPFKHSRGSWVYMSPEFREETGLERHLGIFSIKIVFQGMKLEEIPK